MLKLHDRFRSLHKLVLAAPLALVIATTVPASLADDESKPAKPAKKDCDMTYTLKGWSAVYKTAHGTGRITCDNGQTADVELSIHGGGLTFGKTEIYNGKAEISGVKSIDQIFGSYAAASAHAGMVKAGETYVMTKGPVSLALAGSGSGVDVGIDFSKFKIEKAGQTKGKKTK